MCDVILNAPPGEIRWIVSNHHLSPLVLLERFTARYPNSVIAAHCLRLNPSHTPRCAICENKLIELMKIDGKYGTAES